MDIIATMPTVSQKICFVLKDEDVGKDDWYTGYFGLKVDDICDGHYNNLTFIDIYGSPINKREWIYDQMNYNAKIGSRWNGRILMLFKVNINDSKCFVTYLNVKYYKLQGYGIKEENDEKKVTKDFNWWW